MWDIGWELWEHRNDVLHQQDNLVSAAEEEKLNNCIRKLFQPATRDLKDTRDGYLVKESVRKILSKPEVYKRAWERRVEHTLQAVRAR